MESSPALALGMVRPLPTPIRMQDPNSAATFLKPAR